MILPSTLLSTFESLVCFIQDTGNLTSVDDLRYSVMWRQRVGCKRCITQGRLGVWNLGMAEDIFQFEWRWGLSYQTAEETVTSAVFLATALIPCSIPVPAWEKSTPLPLGRVSTLLAWIVASMSTVGVVSGIREVSPPQALIKAAARGKVHAGDDGRLGRAVLLRKGLYI